MARNPFDMSGSVAVITGGGTGIGKAIALEMAGLGADVVIASRKLENLEKVAADVRALGRHAVAVRADVRNPDDAAAVVDATMREFGRIDVLVNNAGASFVAPFEKISPNGWDAIVAINLKGTFLFSQAAGKVMIAQKRGNIVNISSMAGAALAAGMAHYGAAKAAVINLTRSLAVEWAPHNIRVNCVAPGPVVTEGYAGVLHEGGARELPPAHNALGRWGQPTEIAWPVIFLASEASSYMTGQTICVDGGPRPDEG